MTKHNSDLFVTSHVARDLLQSSAVFEHPRLVVWEYVSNGLDYVDAGVRPVVKVIIDNKKSKITVFDTGRGMDLDGLKNYFTMHGENVDRKASRRVRGFFGTGKSAAFGIANVLRLTSVRSGKRSVVELTKKDIQAVTSGDKIPVRVLEREVATTEPNGTKVEIEDIRLQTIDQSSIIEYIERHLARWSKDASVFVNTHECEYREPAVREVVKFTPPEALKAALGDAELTVKVAKTPLSEDDQGIAIMSHGVWYETTLAGSERKDQANLIFGQIDVAELGDQGNAEIPAFDLSRRMKLNKSNPLVQKIHAFIGTSVEQVRSKLVEEEKARKRSEETQALKREASKIAEIINSDFSSFKHKLQTQQAKLKGAVDKRTAALKRTDGVDPVLAEGGDIDAALERLSRDKKDKVVGPDPQPNPNPPADRDAITRDTEKPTVKAREDRGTKANPPETGGFNVDFNNAGIEALRAQYEPASRTIWINLDHPQLAAALSSSGREDPKFRRLAYEVAFTEYSIALVHELDAAKYYFEVQEAIYDVRVTLNRVSRAAAALYVA